MPAGALAARESPGEIVNTERRSARKAKRKAGDEGKRNLLGLIAESMIFQPAILYLFAAHNGKRGWEFRRKRRFEPLSGLADTLSPMSLPYNQLAGRSVERLAALSDGVFAIAMTLLVLDLHVPARELIHSEHDLWRTLVALSPRLLVYGMSVLTLGIFWNGQQVQLNHLSHGDRGLAWTHIAFLAGISLMPFSTALLAEFIHFRVALLVYWADLLLLGAILYASWRCAVNGGLVKEDLSDEVRCAIERRILIAQGLYAFGALLCIFDTYWSIAFIVFWQLNFAIAPRVRWLSWF